MGFKLPGQSIQAGTSAHKSALKKVAVAKAMTPNKAMESPSKETKESFSQAYRKNRDAGKKYFMHDGKEFTTESRSEKAAREKRGKTYAEENPKKTTTTTKEVKDKDPIAESIKKNNPIGPREGTKKEKVDVAKKNVKETKKEGKIKTLKAKKELAETKGRSRRAERLSRKIERKETGKTRREQRLERKLAKVKDKRTDTPATAMAPNKAMTPNKAMSPAKKPLVGKQKNLPDHLKKKILEA